MGPIAGHALNALHRQARRKITRAELPRTEPVDAHAQYGSGRACALCGTPVSPDELEFLLYFDHPWTGRAFGMHQRCYDAWAAALGRREP
ncbi:MAG: hypothetical protein DIU56_007040 [Pseudomonadota bacterium]|jgi:hypothetical protein|nr:MAG: hypothetical protein DIU56_00020 [Pseudomonadota bacterium]